jgi:hypothetical protein
VQLDVFVELLRNAGRQIQFGHVATGLRRDLNAPLDLSNLVGVLIDRAHIARAELLAEPCELLRQRVEDAAALLHAQRTNLGRRAAPEQPLEDDLRIELHRKRSGARHGLVVRCRQPHP